MFGKDSNHWTIYGTYALIVACAVALKGFEPLKRGIEDFFSGSFYSAVDPDYDLVDACPLALASLAIMLPVALVTAHLVHWLHPGAQVDEDKLKFDKHGGSYFALFFSVIVAEELFARWLFLDVIGSRISGDVAFYTLFVLGNGLWALVHLSNYENEFGRSYLWIVPQFVLGIPLTIIYTKHGFMAALLTHFAYDTMIWCGKKVQQFDFSDALDIAFSGVYLWLGNRYMKKPGSDTLAWFHGSSDFALEGWSMNDYFWLAIWLNGLLGLVFGILLYDHTGAKTQESDSSGAEGGCFGLLIGIIGVAVLIGVLAVAGVFAERIIFSLSRSVTNSVPAAILVYGLFACFQAKSNSLSAVCRTFWTGLPFAAIFICTLNALPYWEAVRYMFWLIVFLAPGYVVTAYARER